MARRIIRWIRKVLLWSVGAFLLLAVAGAIYQLIATEVDERRYPPPGELVDVSGTRNLSAGTHTVRVEYLERTGLAEANVSWALGAPPPPPDCSSSLQTLINNAPAGSTLTVPNCTYRESVTVNKALTIDGGGQASVRGSDVWSGFSSSGGNWVSSQSVPTLHTETRNICLSTSDQRCKLPEQVFIDGAPQYQLATGSDPGPGQFALNGSRQIVLGSDPAGKMVEVTTRTGWLETGASGVTVQGFDMRHAANLEGTGGLENYFLNNFTLKNSTLQYAHAANANFYESKNVLIENSQLLNSGHSGLGASKTQIAIVGGEIAHNNTEDYDPFWAAAGLKMTNARTDVTSPAMRVEGVHVHHNEAPGIWLDISANNALIKDNRVNDNFSYGIFYEVSQSAEITGNVLYNNGDPSLSGVGGANICICNSSNVNVHDNIVAWGNDGIGVVSDNRTSDWPAYNSTTGIQVHHNTILRDQSGHHVLALGWMQTFAGVLYDPASANEGYDNAYWFPNPEPRDIRWGWNGGHTTLSSFNATPGEERGRYLTDAEKDAVLATHNIPPP
jgi:parallel beta-helix repeat protein